MTQFLIGFASLAAIVLPAVAWAQPRLEPLPPKVFTLRPAAAPVPALKYRLLPERRELIPGNAAVFYHRAVEKELLIRSRQFQQQSALGEKDLHIRQAQTDEKAYEWLNKPIRELPREEVRALLDRYRGVLHEVELGARRESCDWEFDRRDEGFTLVLEEIQQMRTLARLVTLQGRLEVLEGRTDQAIHTIQTGFAMARHVSQGPTMIQALVGGALAQVTIGVVEDLIQAPGTPDLFWALAVLPRPLIDGMQGLEGERLILEREIPGLRNLDSDPWSLERARSFSVELQGKLAMLTDGWPRIEGVGPGPPRLDDWRKQLAFTAAVARTYPDAKRGLIAQGLPTARVEAMPTIQVVALYWLKLYEQMRDEVDKWGNIPYPAAQKGFAEVEHRIAASRRERKSSSPFLEVLPPIRNFRAGLLRVERRLDALRCVEAIRLYAEAHGGSLPPRLDAITEAPAPPDPATGQPFDYRATDSSATLTAPTSPLMPAHDPFGINYELKFTP